MPAGLSVAVLLLAQASAVAPSAPPPPAPPTANKPCESTTPTADSDEIVVCVERMEGYRIDPDVLDATRNKRGTPKPKPRERLKNAPGLCENIGGCRGMEGVNLVGLGLAAARLAARAAQGESIRDIFATDPQPSEYELYQQAKREREAREADEAGKDLIEARKNRTEAAEPGKTEYSAGPESP